WREAWGKNTTSNTTTFTWLQRDKFYSLSTATTPETELYMVRAGANDPDYHLRSEGAFLVREKGRTNHTFATALETHGTYDLQVEQSANLTASCREVKVIYDTPEATIVRVSFKEGQQVTLCVAWEGDADRRYRIKAEGERFEWKGAYHLVQKK
ncbi:MAG: chondroitin lyase, partial [Alistipes sp.]|nr:chondroitin lyase [Alistipes sp.]